MREGGRARCGCRVGVEVRREKVSGWMMWMLMLVIVMLMLMLILSELLFLRLTMRCSARSRGVHAGISGGTGGFARIRIEEVSLRLGGCLER